MNYKEEKQYYESGPLMRHFFEDENGYRFGERRVYHMNGQLSWHYFSVKGSDYGEVKSFSVDGTTRYHYLIDGEGDEIASVVECNYPDTHSEEQLIQIAKEHNLPLLSELPKTEAELTLWNLKWPDLPLLPIVHK